MELQARFDEENNILWANKLMEEGARVIFGVPGIKVHSKIFLISRKEKGALLNMHILEPGILMKAHLKFIQTRPC